MTQHFTQREWELIANALNTEAQRLERIAARPGQSALVLTQASRELREISNKACAEAWPTVAA